MSNLYMTTEEFADMVVEALHDQNYFKKGGKHHPGDIVIAFTSAAESIAAALEWAIGKEFQVKKEQDTKQAMMRTANLAKNDYHKATYYNDSNGYATVVLPMDDEIAPALLEPGESVIPDDYELGYSEWKRNKKGK